MITFDVISKRLVKKIFAKCIKPEVATKYIKKTLKCGLYRLVIHISVLLLFQWFSFITCVHLAGDNMLTLTYIRRTNTTVLTNSITLFATSAQQYYIHLCKNFASTICVLLSP